MPDTINLRFLDLHDLGGAALMADNEQKWKALSTLGIEKDDHPNSTPLVAWRDAMADENGIPRAQLDPSQGGCLDLGFTTSDVRLFVMFLA